MQSSEHNVIAIITSLLFSFGNIHCLYSNSLIWFFLFPKLESNDQKIRQSAL